jgi:sugar phosphate isomerase/epimerase
MAPRIHLGINTCFAVKRWPEPDVWIPIVVETLGLRHCQVSFDLVDPLLDQAASLAYAEAVRTKARHAGLTVHSAFSGLAAYSWSGLLHPDRALRAAAMRWYEQAIDVTAALGADLGGGYVGAFSVRDVGNAERRRVLLTELAQRLHDLTLHAAQRGLRGLLVENMAVPREWGHTIDEARVLTAMGAPEGVPIVLCLDLGHPCPLNTGTASDDPLAWLREPWTQTPVLHLQQTDRTGDHHWPFTDAYNARGIIHPQPVLEAIQQWPATDVFMFLEIIHPFEAADEAVLRDLRTSVQYWQDALARSGGAAVQGQ